MSWASLLGGALGGVLVLILDVQTRMHPLTYTAPVSKADYLGGRFLAAFVLKAGELSRGHTPRTRGSLHA